MRILAGMTGTGSPQALAMLAAALLVGCGQLLDLDWRPAESSGSAAGSGGSGGGDIRLPTPPENENPGDASGSGGTGGAGGAGATSSTAASGASSASASTSGSTSAGAGGGSQCSTDSDCPGVDTDCRVRDCAAGSCGFLNLPFGASCNGNSVCDGAGNCVECTLHSHCDDDQWCQQGQCVGCEDGEQNGAETDVDCGGPVCKECNEGKHCNVDADCKHDNCVAGLCDKSGLSPASPEAQ